MKPVRYFHHAEFRLQQRNITKEDVVAAIDDASIILPPRGDHHHLIGYVGEGTDRKGLHVVYRETDDEIWIVTAYWVS